MHQRYSHKTTDGESSLCSSKEPCGLLVAGALSGVDSVVDEEASNRDLRSFVKTYSDGLGQILPCCSLQRCQEALESSLEAQRLGVNSQYNNAQTEATLLSCLAVTLGIVNSVHQHSLRRVTQTLTSSSLLLLPTVLIGAVAFGLGCRFPRSNLQWQREKRKRRYHTTVTSKDVGYVASSDVPNFDSAIHTTGCHISTTVACVNGDTSDRTAMGKEFHGRCREIG